MHSNQMVRTACNGAPNCAELIPLSTALLQHTGLPAQALTVDWTVLLVLLLASQLWYVWSTYSTPGDRGVRAA